MTDQKQLFIDEVMHLIENYAIAYAAKVMSGDLDMKIINERAEAFLQERIGEPVGHYIEFYDIVVYYKTTNSISLYRLDGG